MLKSLPEELKHDGTRGNSLFQTVFTHSASAGLVTVTCTVNIYNPQTNSEENIPGKAELACVTHLPLWIHLAFDFKIFVFPERELFCTYTVTDHYWTFLLPLVLLSPFLGHFKEHASICPGLQVSLTLPQKLNSFLAQFLQTKIAES